MSKIFYNEHQVRTWVHNIIRDMGHDNWRPDYIVGITRGGLVPAVMISHYLGVPMYSLDVSLRDTTDMGPETNAWMSEDALGYPNRTPKNILIVDDINDSGDTLRWIQGDWETSCPPTEEWMNIWNNSVRFATLINNEASNFKDVDYIGTTINKLENPVWCVFPWENWWEK